MLDASDEQTWWSNLFIGGADPGVEIPDGVWESAVTVALGIDTPQPADLLMAADHVAMGVDELDEEAGVHHDVGHSQAHGDALVGDVGAIDSDVDHDSIADDTHHDSIDHDVLYDAAPDDSVVEGDDAIDDQF